jgi:hypothetical protein
LGKIAALLCCVMLFMGRCVSEETVLPGLMLITDPLPSEEAEQLAFAQQAVEEAAGADGTGVFTDDSARYADIRSVFPEEENEA